MYMGGTNQMDRNKACYYIGIRKKNGIDFLDDWCCSLEQSNFI
jgi:hypothetical protein